MNLFSLFKNIIAFLLSLAISYYLTNIMRGTLDNRSTSEINMPSYLNLESSNQFVDTIKWQKISKRIVLPTIESAIYRAYLSLAKHEGKAASLNRYHIVLCDNSWIITTSKNMDNLVGGGHYFEIDKLSGRINVTLGLK